MFVDAGREKVFGERLMAGETGPAALNHLAKHVMTPFRSSIVESAFVSEEGIKTKPLLFTTSSKQV
jgi:hypothetical protein